MANLIPPDAKKTITIEYWIRVVTVWLILVGAALVVVALLKLPTFVLVQSQLNSFSGDYEGAREKEDAFAEAQQTIEEANAMSILLSELATTTTASEIIEIIDVIAGSQVTIQNFTFQQSPTSVESITVTGLATTRVALANFSDDIEKHPLFAEAELPISNLAKDRDITFNIAITPAVTEIE